MDNLIRSKQIEILNIFAKESKTFALSGGTALELLYLKHRFSRDLDFFSPRYNLKEINSLVLRFNKYLNAKMELEEELITKDKAKIRSYIVKIRGSKFPLKIDFVEDVFFKRPVIKRFNNVPVYSAENIYYQKIMALTGTQLGMDTTGREVITGRKEARDVFDIYCLSKMVCPLHKFIRGLSDIYKRGIVYWYRIYSRQDLKFGILDLDIYDKYFDLSKMINYFDKEIKEIINEDLKGKR